VGGTEGDDFELVRERVIRGWNRAALAQTAGVALALVFLVGLGVTSGWHWWVILLIVIDVGGWAMMIRWHLDRNRRFRALEPPAGAD
jgi:hypothetical protein